MWGSATVLPSTEEINALLSFKPLPVKDHYVIYAKEVIHGQVVHVAKLLGEDPWHLPPCTPRPPREGALPSPSPGLPEGSACPSPESRLRGPALGPGGVNTERAEDGCGLRASRVTVSPGGPRRRGRLLVVSPTAPLP